MFGAIMYVSRVILAVLPNIHLLGMLVMTLTVVFRVKALIPIYIYVMLEGILSGFALWWYPYLYVWTVLWALTMLIPKRTPRKLMFVLFPVLCALHGFSFGILYAPMQAFLYGYNFEQTLIWIAKGSLFDITHGISNIFAGMLVLPFSELIYLLVYKKELYSKREQ